MVHTIDVDEKIYTVEEWLELEKASEIRHEFYYGKLIPMAGEAKNANRIAINFILKMNAPLLERGLEIFAHDVKTEVVGNGIYRYPDLVVAPLADDADEYIVKLAVALVEIASENSKHRDKIKKRKEYREIETLWYYLVVIQNEMSVELHTKDGNGNWQIEYFTEPEDEIFFPRFEIKMKLKEIYERIIFPN